MTDEQLISKLSKLKAIQPRKDWVVLSKAEILGSDVSGSIPAMVAPTYLFAFSNIINLAFKRKYAYSLALFLFVFVGFFGQLKYGLITNNIPGRELSVAGNVEQLKLKSQNLATALISKQEKEISVAIKDVKNITKNLTKAIAKDPASVKSIALDVTQNKTYLDILGAPDLKETSDLLYKAIDEQMIDDLQNTSLTESQKKTFDHIRELYSNGKYSEALESILLIK